MDHHHHSFQHSATKCCSYHRYHRRADNQACGRVRARVFFDSILHPSIVPLFAAYQSHSGGSKETGIVLVTLKKFFQFISLDFLDLPSSSSITLHPITKLLTLPHSHCQFQVVVYLNVTGCILALLCFFFRDHVYLALPHPPYLPTYNLYAVSQFSNKKTLYILSRIRDSVFFGSTNECVRE